MTENIIPQDIRLFQLKTEWNYQEDPKEVEIKVTPRVIQKSNEKCIVLFDTTFTYDFRIQIEIIANYIAKDIVKLEEEQLQKIIVENSYSIYGKTLFVMGFILDQMEYSPYYISFSQFMKFASKE